jgi:hypothetical protein
VTEILSLLKRIESEHDCRVLFAVESGSRAWGFPSPDSDFDVRFVYAKPVDWHLRIDRRSGQRVFGEWPSADPRAAVIWEAFKPESEPRRTVRRDEMVSDATAEARARTAARRAVDQPRDSDFLQREGGIY